MIGVMQHDDATPIPRSVVRELRRLWTEQRELGYRRLMGIMTAEEQQRAAELKAIFDSYGNPWARKEEYEPGGQSTGRS